MYYATQGKQRLQSIEQIVLLDFIHHHQNPTKKDYKIWHCKLLIKCSW